MKIGAVIVDYRSKEKVEKLGRGLRGGEREVFVVDNNKTNRGFAKAVNIGIKKALTAGAEKIVLINPDIEITKKDITDLLTDNADIVGPVLLTDGVCDYGGKVNWVLGRTSHQSLVTSHSSDYISGACMVIDRKVFEKVGLFDERFFMYFEDADFCLRAKQAGFKIAITPKIIIKHKLTKNKQKNNYVWESNKKFVEKWIKWYFKPAAYLYLWILQKLL